MIESIGAFCHSIQSGDCLIVFNTVRKECSTECNLNPERHHAFGSITLFASASD